jgi:hypothetical protein
LSRIEFVDDDYLFLRSFPNAISLSSFEGKSAEMQILEAAMTQDREPTLDDLLSEPIIQTVMDVYGHTADDIRHLMRLVGARKMRSTLQNPSRTAHARQS